jgi:hypothetical protein
MQLGTWIKIFPLITSASHETTNLIITQSRCSVNGPVLVMYVKSGNLRYNKVVLDAMNQTTESLNFQITAMTRQDDVHYAAGQASEYKYLWLQLSSIIIYCSV